MSLAVNNRKDNWVCLHKKGNVLVQINEKYGVGYRLDWGAQESVRFWLISVFPKLLFCPHSAWGGRARDPRWFLVGLPMVTCISLKQPQWATICLWWPRVVTIDRLASLNPNRNQRLLKRNGMTAAYRKRVAEKASNAHPSQNLWEYRNYTQSDPVGLGIKRETWVYPIC